MKFLFKCHMDLYMFLIYHMNKILDDLLCEYMKLLICHLTLISLSFPFKRILFWTFDLNFHKFIYLLIYLLL